MCLYWVEGGSKTWQNGVGGAAGRELPEVKPAHHAVSSSAQHTASDTHSSRRPWLVPAITVLLSPKAMLVSG